MSSSCTTVEEVLFGRRELVSAIWLEEDGEEPHGVTEPEEELVTGALVETLADDSVCGTGS